jgi:hypothetical protein
MWGGESGEKTDRCRGEERRGEEEMSTTPLIESFGSFRVY